MTLSPKLTWNIKKAYPFGGKAEFDRDLCGQSTPTGPKRLKDAVMVSAMIFYKNRRFMILLSRY